jgi:hypothetical protein
MRAFADKTSRRQAAEIHDFNKQIFRNILRIKIDGFKKLCIMRTSLTQSGNERNKTK